MAYSQQKILNLEVELLKSLKDLTIDFKEDGLTGILGPNGNGKSTIIHALACVYQPPTGSSSINYKFSQFFIPTIHSQWSGSKFKLKHDYRIDNNVYANTETEYSKDVDRWTPKYSRRPERYTSFIGVRSCVPSVELENQQYLIRFNTIALNDIQSNRLRDLAGRVMNRNYTNLNSHETARLKRYIGVTHGTVSYSSLTMGAGEQRIFHVLSEVLKAPNYGLILIDEIDLLMHEDALKRLLVILRELASSKHLQIIFSTHNHNILKSSDINFRHIQQTTSKTLCHVDTNIEALYRLTGEQLKPYELFVEDDLSKFLVKQIAHELSVGRETSIKKFGPAINCFTTACGALLTGTENYNNMLFVLDGDLYRTLEEKRVQVNRVLTGNIADLAAKRERALDKIAQLIIPDEISPERYYRNIIVALNDEALDSRQLELKTILGGIENPPDDHEFISILAERIGLENGEVLTLFADLLSLTPEWEVITLEIRTWLTSVIPQAAAH